MQTTYENICILDMVCTFYWKLSGYFLNLNYYDFFTSKYYSTQVYNRTLILYYCIINKIVIP